MEYYKCNTIQAIAFFKKPIKNIPCRLWLNDEYTEIF